MIDVMFDHGIFTEQKYGGISRYFVRLAAHLDRGRVHARVFAPLHVNAYLSGLPATMGAAYLLPQGRVTAAIARAIDEVLYPWAIRRWSPRIVHETFYGSARAIGNARRVATIHDMIPEMRPDIERDHPALRAKRAAVERADLLICVSRQTESDLWRIYPSAVGRTAVVHHGFDHVVASDRIVHPRPYILFVGHRGGYKNFAGLIAAVGSSVRISNDLDIVCAGGGPLSKAEQDMVSALPAPMRVVQVDVDDIALGALYHHASVFVYPTLYEGFGIPPLEAMSADCPVVCVRAGAVPEICGDAVEYAEPGRVEDLGAAIERVLYSTSRRDALVAAGRSRANLFSWTRCAAGTKALYEAF